MAEAVNPFADSVEANPLLALMVIGVKVEDSLDGDNDPDVSTFINIAGRNEVIAEGLYAELASHIEAGDFSFVSLLAEVIHDLQDDYKVDLLNPPTAKKQKAKLYVVPKSDPTVH